MRFLSLFSGIEAASEAWAPLGWECAAVAEIEPFPNRVLAHRHPGVRNLGDVTKITEMDIASLGDLDVIIFGSPCQDLSIAGKRQGLDGARSGLFFTAVDIIRWARFWCGARFALWENVPGAFSSNKGRDFAAVVDALSGMDGAAVPPSGWGTEGAAVGPEAMVEWAVLDAQYFGVAQRRRRVFALADFGNWAGREPILLEPQGLRGDSAPSREAREETAGTLASRTAGGGFPGTDEACSGYIQAVVARPGDGEAVRDVICMAHGQAGAEIAVDRGPTLTCNHEAPIVTYEEPYTLAVRGRGDGSSFEFRQDGTANTLLTPNGGRAGIGVGAIAYAIQVGALRENPDSGPDGIGVQAGRAYTLEARRLTVEECEFLQGFPRGYTKIPWRGKPASECPDGPRYKALGNSMAVPVIRWIGRRIELASLFGE